jgi:phenylpropionate dioxygenase-like ring-hydroxylating dioxygenase large terminal subunit
VATWGGFVFLHLTPTEAVPLADQLGPVPERLRRYPLEALAVGRRLAYRVAANWKLIAENYNECYHCAGVHPSCAGSCRRSSAAGPGWTGTGASPTARAPGPSPPPAPATGRRSPAWTTTSTRASWSTVPGN